MDSNSEIIISECFVLSRDDSDWVSKPGLPVRASFPEGELAEAG
jgi:hypothetical protein